MMFYCLISCLSAQAISGYESNNIHSSQVSPKTQSEIVAQREKDMIIWKSAFSTATRSTNSQRIDLVFVIDVTGSMGDEISGVKNNITEFMNLFASTGIQLRVGFIEYQDITHDGNSSTIIHKNGSSVWHTTSEQAKSTFNKISAKDGGDTPETPIDALGNLIDGIDVSSEFDWDYNASRFAVLITDAGFKTNNNHGYTGMDDFINACMLSTRKLTVSVITDPSCYNDYKDLAEKTGGILGNINSNFASLLSSFAMDIMSKIDTDGDGLLDEWEESGDINNDGVIDIIDADINKSDIYVKIDWMPGFKPSNKALSAVCDSFENSGAGYQNKGIALHLVWGREIPHIPVIDLSNNYDQWLNLANTYFNNNIERRVYRWALFADQYDSGYGVGSSGIASNIPGQIFLVTLGGAWAKYRNDTVVGGTFMHELGHTLGLCHGGQDHINDKPNYLSVMNYLFQVDGLVGTGDLDYSRYVLPTINENNISESNGFDPLSLTAGTGLGTKLYKQTGIDIFGWRIISWLVGDKEEYSIAGKAIDFNLNGKTTDTGLRIDLNNDGVYEELKSYNDWENITFHGGTIGMKGATLPQFEVNPPEEISQELTYDEAVSVGYLTPIALPSNVTLFRKTDADFFKDFDTSEIYWKVDNEKLFKIDNVTGELKFKLGASSLVFGESTVTATDEAGNILSQSKVKVTWHWWQWILVIVFFGWLYL